MFTGWKGKKPGSHDHSYPSGPTSGPSVGSIGPPGATPGYPTSSSTSGVFGTPINPTSEGPPLLGKFVRFLQTKANTENLFTPNPDLDAEVQVVKKNILRDMATSPTANDDALQLSSYTKSPQVVAELLRLFLAALPEPLLTFQLYDSFLLTQTIQSPADRVWAYRFLLAYLPPGFRSSVKLLLTLLFNLSRSGEANGMDANTLASVFGSYFLRSEEELYYMKDDPALVVQIVALLIQEYESVLRAAPTAPPARTLNSGAQTAASSFPASPTPPHVPRIQVPPQQPVHPLDQSAPQPASLYDHHLAVASQRAPARPQLGATKPIPAHVAPVTSQRPSSPLQSPTPAHSIQSPVQLVPSNPITPTQSPSAQRNSRTPYKSKAEEHDGEAESETLTKLGKLRGSVLLLLNEQISTSIMTLLSAIMAATSAGEAIEVSKALVVVKKFLSDQVQVSLKMDKQAISEYISSQQLPPLSIPPPSPTDDLQLNKLRSAAYQATDQFMEILFYLSSKMSNMTQPEDLNEAVAIAQVAKLLKTSTAEQLQRLHFPPLSATPVTTPISTPVSTPMSPNTPSTPFSPNTSTPFSPNTSTPFSPTLIAPFSPTSPPTSPSPSNFATPLSTAALRQSLSQTRALNTSSSSLPIVAQLPLSPGSASPVRPSPSRDDYVSTIDKEVSVTKQSLEGMLLVLPTCSQTDLVEYAKGIRFTKQLVDEKVSEFALGVDPDARVEAVDGEDKISALRRALTCSVSKIIEQIDALSTHVHSSRGTQLDPRPLAEAITVVARAIANTYKHKDKESRV